MQITKIAVAPAVLVIEALWFRRRASAPVIAAVAVVCLGVGVCMVTDTHADVDLVGAAVGVGAVGSTALYQVQCQTACIQQGQNSP